MNAELSNETYLGDGLYAAWDGYHVVLSANDKCSGNPTDTVYLDPGVVEGLVRFLKRLEVI